MYCRVHCEFAWPIRHNEPSTAVIVSDDTALAVRTPWLPFLGYLQKSFPIPFIILALLFLSPCFIICNSEQGRRSTVEVHPIFPEAPHLRSSTPRPGTDLSKIKLLPDKQSHGPSIHNVFVQKQIDLPTILG